MADDSWPKDFIAGLRIGAIGWLLSCRQAYIEGIDILYSTNIFHITNPYLSTHLPNFIVPQRLSRIRVIEFAWQWGRIEPQRAEETFEYQLASILADIPAQLPCLTSLKIAFQDNLAAYACMHSNAPREEWVPWLEGKVFKPLDQMVEALSGLEECEVYLTASLHRALGKGETSREQNLGGRFWRGCRGDDRKGYWVCVGRDDAPRMVCGLAFS